MEFAYHSEQEKKMILELREFRKGLPDFLEDFFIFLNTDVSAKTRLSYARDIKVFFGYLANEEKDFPTDITQFTIDDLRRVDARVLNRYSDYLTYYIRDFETKTEKNVTVETFNHDRGISRKLSAIRKLFKFYYQAEMLSANPTELINNPKIHEKSIIRLEADEVAKLLDVVDSGEGLTDRQAKYHDFTKLRDAALITLLLGTGMRVSECVGIDMQHIDFENNALIIMRKGGKEQFIYFGEEVEEALQKYLVVRHETVALPGHEDALFLSMQRKRIGVRSVEKLVKKYSSLITSIKKITPHKLRSTFGTNLYQATDDIYLVADVLGHSDVNTTRKHYADMADANRKKAAAVVKLRKD
ncbi:MAG: tyrosine-type recombinase/integrase [Firmicutes bacterium]|nr:tyrosine-type recombinase/integrase [Bacillota bacterium]